MTEKKISLLFKLFMWCYRLVLFPLLLILAFTFGYWFSEKIRRGFRLRREHFRLPKPDWMGKVQPIWVHASSGEFEYCKALLRDIKKRFPKSPILVTYFSPTYVKNIKNTSEVDWVEPLPLDTLGAVGSFLFRWNPKLGLISRTDLWPELLLQCRAKKIPTVLFSATFSALEKHSFFRRTWIVWLLRCINEIHVVSEADKKQLLLQDTALTSFVTGDTRYDQVIYRLIQAKALRTELKPPPGAKILVAGSTWKEDEDILLPVCAPFIKSGQLGLIIAPHEPTAEHLEHLRIKAKSFGISTLHYSQADSWMGQEILLVDQIGILADLYSWGQLAFVGGSFKKSVHSVMEPLGSGALTFVGPLHINNREAIEFQEVPVGSKSNLHAVELVRTPAEWTQKINLWAQQRDQHHQIKSEIVHLVQKKSGASRQLLEGLFERGLLTP